MPLSLSHCTLIIFLFLLGTIFCNPTPHRVLPPFKNIQGPPEDFTLHQLGASRHSRHQSISAFDVFDAEAGAASPPTQSSRGSWHFLWGAIHAWNYVKLPENAHFYVSILMRYDGTQPMDETSDSIDSLLVQFTGPNITVAPLDPAFQLRQLYSFKYWERNWELKTGNGGASAKDLQRVLQFPFDGESASDAPNDDASVPMLCVKGRNVVVVIQDYEPPEDDFGTKPDEPLPTPLIEVESIVDDVRDFFVGREIALNVRLSLNSQRNIEQWAQSRLQAHSSRVISDFKIPPAHEIASFHDVIIDVRDADTQELHHTLRMLDDGNSRDGIAQDGIYGAKFRMTQPGTYEVHIRLSGHIRDPIVSNKVRTFYRSTLHVIKVLDAADDIELDFLASVRQDKANEDFIEFYLPLQSQSTYNLDKKFKAHAQVYGVAEDSPLPQNVSVPVAFMSGMVLGELCPLSNDSPANDNRICLRFKLCKKWLSRARVGTQYFTLKNIFIQDVASSVPLGEREEIRAFALDSIVMGPGSEFTGEVTERMLKGPRPHKLSTPGNKPQKSVLIITHGYCADDSPFSLSDYSNYIAFRDLNQNRFNDDFALRLYEFAELHPEGPFDRYSVVAHSQGGLASTHLLTFYWTGADNHPAPSNTSRIIQSVGSPYLGTVVAGYIAAVGRLVGIACGSNFDLTHEGAALWNALIPRSVREQVYYTTTTWEGNYSYCSLPLNSVLTFKNDGACENRYANLEHANPVAQNLPPWCHTRTMNFPSQCTNSQMNHDYNANAAR